MRAPPSCRAWRQRHFQVPLSRIRTLNWSGGRRPLSAHHRPSVGRAAGHCLRRPPARIADADRDAVVDRLRQASTEGRLDLDEFADRVGLVYRSSTQAELDVSPSTCRRRPRRPAGRPRAGPSASSAASGGRSWRPASPTWAWATFGTCHVDLAEIDCDDDEVAAGDGGVRRRRDPGAGGRPGRLERVRGVRLEEVPHEASRTPASLPVRAGPGAGVFGNVTVRNPRPRVP